MREIQTNANKKELSMTTRADAIKSPWKYLLIFQGFCFLPTPPPMEKPVFKPK